MPRVTVINRTAYNTDDLCRLFERGLVAMGVRESKTIKVLPSNELEGRGIAYVGRQGREGHSMVFLLPPPWKMTFRRLTRLFEHEVLHTLGKEHSCPRGARGCKAMTDAEYWSKGPVPSWSRGVVLRWNGAQRRGMWR